MNPSTRLLALYDSLTGNNADMPMIQKWTNLFDLDAESSTIEDDTTACLMALRSEIDLVRASLDSLGVPTSLSNPGFERLRETASARYLQQGWNGLRGNIQAPECRHAFAWSAWLLRDEADDEMDSSDKAEISAALDALEEKLAHSELSPYLRSFIDRQVANLRRALRASKVQGVKPLRDAMRGFAGDLTVEDAAFRAEVAKAPASAQDALAELADVADKAGKVCDGVGKTAAFGYKIGTVINTVLQVLQ